MSVLATGALVGGSAVAGAATVSAAAPTPTRTGPSRIGSAPTVPRGAAVLGALSASSPLQATVTLNPSDAAALTSYATAVSTPGTALYQHYLSTAQFAARFGPSAAQVSAVHQVLAAAGLHPGAVSANHLAISIHGSTATFSKAFSTSFRQVRLASGRVAYTNTRAPLIAGSIRTTVQGVIGLNTLALAHPETAQTRTPATATRSHPASPHVVTGGPQPCAAATASTTSSGYTADQLASAYGFSGLYAAGAFGAGQTIAVYELAENSTTDIAGYQSCYGTNAPISYQQVDGGSTGGGNSGEAILDIENVIGIAPKAKQIVYQGPNSGSGGYDTFNTIITANVAKIITTSYGLCESQNSSQSIAAENTLFKEAAIQGQSLFDAAGDNGSEDCGGTDTSLAVDDPGGQPYVTVVGGTTLTKIGPRPTETVWNDRISQGAGGAGGGGISSIFTMPSYQTGAAASLHVINAHSSGTPCGAAAGSYCREEPDVSLDSDPYTGFVLYFNGAWTSGNGGTSGAAPIWAAYTALVNSSSACHGKDIGFANPALYAIAGTSAYAADFNDITVGNNDDTGTNNGLYPSATGYDMASGLGTPNGTALAASFCPASTSKPTITKVSPKSGPTSGGTTVTITGTGFTGASKVAFGSVSAKKFTVVSSTRITAVSPARAAGLHNIYVTTGAGTSTVVTADRFTYVSRPAITRISPKSGTTKGGTWVTITGTGFTGASTVFFGSVAAREFTVISSTEIRAVSPARATGVHNIYVTTSGGTSNAVSADRFTYDKR